jgi:hypothetical protein
METSGFAIENGEVDLKNLRRGIEELTNQISDKN